MLEDLLGCRNGPIHQIRRDRLRPAAGSQKPVDLGNRCLRILEFEDNGTPRPIRKIKLSRKADMTPIDIMLPVNRWVTGAARLK
jgi:hypothetical protein